MYKIEISKSAEKELAKLDEYSRKQIQSYINNNIANEDPRNKGKALKHNWAGHWRYDIGKYRIICQIKDEICIVLIVKIGHRREIYR
jgi:mRNA interferase RelE/StbE